MFLDKRASQRSKDENGYLIVKNNPIAKAGVFEYLHSELFEDSKDDTIVKVYRDFDSLKSVKDTFANKPIMHNHQWVGEEADQVDGAIGSEITIDEDNQMLRADLIFYNPKLIQAIESGEDIELSPGYTGEIEEQKGRFDGQSYDYTQLTDYCNHLAVVRNGRAGKDLKIQDSKINTEEDMNKEEKKRLLDSLKKVLGFKDEEATVTVEDKCKTEDEEKKEESKKTMDSELSEIINIARNEDMSEEDKLKAIKSLIGSGDPAKTETEDEDPAEEEKKDNMGIDLEKLAEVFGEVVDERVEKKLNSFQDESAKESKRITDTYTRVSDALGTNFNYNGMSVDEILKFGYESLTGQVLEEGMNANTAFTIATQSKRGNTFEDAKPDTKEDSKIMKMLEEY